MKITSQMMSEFITQNPIRKVVFTPMLMGEISARLFCENDTEITIDIHKKSTKEDGGSSAQRRNWLKVNDL